MDSIQRSICGHLTEEMTERYSSVAQAEVEAALGKVISLAGYRDLLSETPGGCEMGGGKADPDANEPLAAAPVQVPERSSFS